MNDLFTEYIVSIANALDGTNEKDNLQCGSRVIDALKRISDHFQNAKAMSDWNIAVRLAPSLTDSVAAANNAKTVVKLFGSTIEVDTDVSTLAESASSNPAQGTHKWLGIGIGTGLSSVTLAKYNGVQLTDDDATEAASVGLTNDGEFILYVKADKLAEAPARFTIEANGRPAVNLAVALKSK